MRKEQKQMLTARQFAEALQRPYPTVMGWLQTGKVPGAQLVDSPIGSYYEIPADIVVTFEAPKRGRPGKASTVNTATTTKKEAKTRQKAG
jgi:hypothetical protein